MKKTALALVAVFFLVSRAYGQTATPTPTDTPTPTVTPTDTPTPTVTPTATPILTNPFRFDNLQTKVATWLGITQSQAPLSPANDGRMIYDTGAQDFMCSKNGGAYATCSGAGPAPTPIPSRNGSVWIALGECQDTTASALVDLPAAAATPGAAVSACVTGTNTQQGVLNYGAGVNVAGQVTYFLPTNNGVGNGGFDNSATTTANIVWFSTTTSGNVVWDLQTSCVATGASNDPSWTSNTVTSAAQGVASTLQTATDTLSLGSCNPGDTLHLQLVRNAGAGSDTMAGTASAIGIELNVARQ